MHNEFLMGNAAIAMGAIASGVNLVAGYPGTPSTEVLETIAKHRPEHTYVEWSVNEKAALELAAGASYSGARTMVTMKQVGLNVASDPLMSLEYVGIKGGMIILVADDPGPISSQTEQDTRHFAAFSKLPCFDPSSAQEAYEMVQEAYEYSEKYGTPVFLRPTTRVCHGYASITVKDESEYQIHTPDGFIKDSKRWVIFPRLSYANHQKIEARNVTLAEDFSSYSRNQILPATPEHADVRRGIATGGISFTYTMETMQTIGMYRTLKVATPHPFPEQLAVRFLEGLDEVLCIEELDPVIERELTYICGKYQLPVKILGKLTHHVANAGENTRDSVSACLYRFLELPLPETETLPTPPELPVRPPVLCSGCPHRASFYAVKKAMQGKKTIFCGDIGCYTLGNAMPLDMVDTCLCMGAGLNIAQGVGRIEPDTTCFAFVGDSTFFASAITGVVNAVYNQANMVLIVLDNSTTAMTGHQPHPGTGHTMMGEIVAKVSIEAVLRGIGLTTVETINPLDLEASVDCVKRVAAEPGVKAIIFKSPCIAITKPDKPLHVETDTCINCKKCIRELGCPAIVIHDGQVQIDSSLCTGCTLCSQVCPVHAITGGDDHE
ncbi:MAG: indolepyruvate ferredoxin oxidoreductase subunit alpha [Lachnospiraceae bacterium]|nr:indolepyruvate ferredoxin oxidoreductase subunit alpha [Lachnospiraceae bacterium]